MSIQDRSSTDNDPIVVSYAGELDASDQVFGPDLLGRLEQGQDRIIVDFLNVSFIDSSIIRSLVLAHRRASRVDGWIRVVYTHHMVKRVIEMCGLAEVFPQYPTIQAAWGPAREGRPS